MRTDILQELERIVRLAGNLVREAHDIEQVTTEKTGAADLVTKYDVAVQGLLKRELLTLLPEADFFGEEGEHAALTRPWTFIVDPIDGTTNFVRRLHYSNISVALAHDGQVEYGHLEPKACLNLMRSLCKGRSEYDPKLCAAYNKATRNGKDMRHASAMLEAAVGSIVQQDERSAVDSLFGNGLSTFLDPGVQGLDDFELVCFLVVQGKEA